MIGKGHIETPLADLWVRDPESFVAGEPHKHTACWEYLTQDHPQKDQIMSWITDGINIREFIVPFHGTYRRKRYHHSFPPDAIFPNNKSCIPHAQIISKEIEKKIAMGAITLLGRVGEVPPPRIVMPFSIEPSKPRLVHDQQYLNCFMKHLPFKLDQVINLPRYLGKESYHTKLDDKSGFDHFLLSEDSRTLVGAEWGGWWLVWNTLCQGWKESPYIYQTLGSVATSHIREVGTPSSQYIDDRHLGELWGPTPEARSSYQAALAGAVLAIAVLTELGYFINIDKSVVTPTQQLVFLGHTVDTVRETFSIPDDKKQKFIALRDSILCKQTVSLNTLQRLQGKCISLSLMVPAAKLYTRQIARAISQFNSSTKPIPMTGDLRQEIEHWRFIDNWEGCLPWRKEEHSVLKVIFSDASLAQWGGVLSTPQGIRTAGDYFQGDAMSTDIAVKESYGLLYTIRAFQSELKNCRVDAHVDNSTLYFAWEGQGCRNQAVNNIVKLLFEATIELNISLHLELIPSEENPADSPSRCVSDNDVMLSPQLWSLLQDTYGGPNGHTIDLMALDSNSQLDKESHPLPHYTPRHTLSSIGVNFFAQNPAKRCCGTLENGYIFPPTHLVGPVLKHLQDFHAIATLVAPEIRPLPYWWPSVQRAAKKKFKIALKGDETALLWPSKSTNSFTIKRPLPWNLWAFRLDFSSGY